MCPISPQGLPRLAQAAGPNAPRLANTHAQFVFKDRQDRSQILQTVAFNSFLAALFSIPDKS